MIDQTLRAAKDRWLRPLVRWLAGHVGAAPLTALSLAGGVGGGVAAGFGLRWQAVGLWLLGRFFDLLDGAVARERARESDLGGYVDMMADTVAYAAVPIGIAFAQSREQIWLWCAILLATFYVNTLSWTYLAAVAEKRGRGAAGTGARTTVNMPTGLIEGAESVAFFVVMLAFPDFAVELFAAMAALVAVTVVQRLVWAARTLH